MNNCNDIELAILKGHILIENLLNHFVYKVSSHLGEFEETKFNFSQKLHLFYIFATDNVTEIKNSINLLNKLRNEIAHRLTFEEKLLQTFITSVIDNYKSMKGFKEENTLDTIKSAITFLCGCLYGQIEMESIKKDLVKDLISGKSKALTLKHRENEKI